MLRWAINLSVNTDRRPNVSFLMRHGETQAHDDEKPPRFCPVCGQDLGDFPYYQFYPARFARRLQALAAFLLPVMGIVFVVQLFSGNFLPHFSMASGYFILLYVCTPSLLIYSVSLVIPKVHRVICLHCSWYRDYPFRWGLFEAK